MMTQRTHTRWTALALTGLLGVLAACGGPQDPAEQRAQRIAQSDGPILIGAAWPWEARTSGYYWEGLELAVREVNEAGGIQGRPIELVREDDRESVNEGRLVAQRLANNPDVVAVIGHLNSHVTLPAAGTYEAAGLVMLTPASTTPELTEKGYRRIFRSVNNDVMIGQQMVDYAVSKGYTNVAIAYVRNAYGLGLANAFERRAIEAGVHIVDRQAYDSAVRDTRVSFDRIIDEWKDRRFDAIFLAGMAPEAGYFVKHVRAAGIDASMFGGDALDTQSLIESAGPAAEGLVVASIFHPDNPRPEVQQFNEVFSTAYGIRPDSWAARGYEAVWLLARAMQEADSAAPDAIAEALRSAEAWNGVTGTFGFDERGEVHGKSLLTVVVRDQRFIFMQETPALLTGETDAKPLTTAALTPALP